MSEYGEAWARTKRRAEAQRSWNPGSGATPFDEYLAASAEVGEVPPTVCIRHGKYLPCRNGYTNDDCLKTQHPAMVKLVQAYQRDTDAVRWDFEHVVKSWLYIQKGEGNW